jgi:hypothetical protein
MTRLAGVVAVVVACAACTGTTYDETLESTTSSATTTTFAPTGTTDELLTALFDEVAVLEGIIRNKGDRSAAAQRIESLWAAAADDVKTTRPELFDDFQESVDLALIAANKNRAADADKAERNLQVMIDAFRS